MREADNLTDLMRMPSRWVDRIRQRRPMKKLILDMDSSVSEIYGQHVGLMYKGHFACECYHPLFVSNGASHRRVYSSGAVDCWPRVYLHRNKESTSLPVRPSHSDKDIVT